MEKTHDVIVVIDDTYTIQWCSPSAATLLGYAPEELRGLSAVELIHPDGPSWSQEELAGFDENEAVEVEALVKGKDGRPHWLAVTTYWIADPVGGGQLAVVMARDIDDEVRARDARDEASRLLRDSEFRYHLLVDSISDMVIVSHLDGSLEWISDSATSFTGWSPEELASMSLEDLIHDEDLPRVAATRERIARGERVAVEARMRRRAGPDLWTQVNAREIRDESGRRLRVTAWRDIDDEVRARAQLASVEQHYRLLVENSYDVVAIARTDGVMEWVSESVRTMLGWEPDDLIGHHTTDFVHPDDTSRVRDLGEGVRRGQRRSEEARLRRPDGEYVWARADVREVDDPTTGRRIRLAAFRDIDDEIRARTEKDASENRYRLLAENASDLVAVVTETGEITWIDGSVEVLTGYGPEELLGRSMFEFLEPESLARAMEVQPRIIQGERVTLEIRVRTKKGDARAIEATIRRVGLSDDGRHLRVVAWRDIDQAVRAREELATSEARYRLLAENVSDMVVQTDERGVVTWVSPSCQRMLDVRPEELVGSEFTSLVVLEDRVKVESLREFTKRGQSTSTHEVRLMRGNGSSMWVELVIHPLLDDGGGLTGRVDALRDIDAEVRARNSLAEIGRQLEFVAESSGEVSVVTDVEGVVRWVSPSLTRVTGWSGEDVIGHRPEEFLVDEDRARADVRFSLALLGEPVEDFVERLRLPSGSFMWVFVRVRSFRDVEGRVNAVAFTLRDHTEAAMTQRALFTISAAEAIMIRAKNEGELLGQMCQAAVDQGGYALAWYGRRVFDEAHTVEVVASSREHREYTEGVLISWGLESAGLGPTGRCLRSGETMVLRDFTADERFAPWRERALSHGLRASAVVPVRVDGEIDGCLTVYAREVGSFGSVEVSTLEDLAIEIGAGLTRLERERRLEEALRAQNLFVESIEQSDESIIITDLFGVVTYANSAAHHSLHRSSGTLVGQRVVDLWSDVEDDTAFAQLWATVTSGHRWSGTVTRRRSDGSRVEEEVHVSPIRDATGSPVAIAGVHRDVTRLHRFEFAASLGRHDQQALARVLENVRPSGDLETDVAELCRQATKLESVDVAAILVMDAQGTETVFHVAGLDSSQVPDHTTMTGLSDSPLVEMTRRGPWGADLRHPSDLVSPTMTEALGATGLAGVVFVPIRFDSRFLAVLGLGTRDPEYERWLEARLPVFEQLGHLIGSLIGPEARRREDESVYFTRVSEVLETHAFRPVFQPFVDLRTSDTVGYEALTRFDDGTRPDEMFDLAARVGLGPDLELACAQAAVDAFRGESTGAWLAVNLSPQAILEGCVPGLVAACDRELVVEITERARVDDYGAIRAAMAQSGGARLAIDDAGVEAASLQHIIELQPSVVKLDITLVRDIEKNTRRQAMVAGLCYFAAQSNVVIIAEGIEYAVEVATLLDVASTLPPGALLGQGYLLGRPGVLAT